MVSFFGTDTSPSSGTSSPDDHPEERRLAGAVRADEADLFAGVELERGVDEEDLPAVLLADLGERNHEDRTSVARGRATSASRGARRRTASCGRCRAPPISASVATDGSTRPSETHAAVGGDDDRLREVEDVRREQQRQLRDASRLHLDRVAAPRRDRRGRTDPRSRKQLLAVVRAGAGELVEIAAPSACRRRRPAARDRSPASARGSAGRGRSPPTSASPAADRAGGCARTLRTAPSSPATTRCCARPRAADGIRPSTPLSRR